MRLLHRRPADRPSARRKDLTMKGMRIAMIAAIVFGMAASTETSAKNSESQLPLNQVVEPGVAKTFGHQRSIVMVDGFWAKAGSNVTAFIDELSNTLIQMATPVPIPTDVSNRPPASGAGSDRVAWNRSQVWCRSAMASRCRTRPTITRSTASGFRRKAIIPACSPSGDGWLIPPLNRRIGNWHNPNSINVDRFPCPPWLISNKPNYQIFDLFIRGVLACGGHTGILPQGIYSSTVMGDQGIESPWWSCARGDRQR